MLKCQKLKLSNNNEFDYPELIQLVSYLLDILMHPIYDLRL